MELRFETKRLILRQLEQRDARSLEMLAGDKEVARTTLGIPHPYPQGMAPSFIESRHVASQKGDGYFFAIVNKQDDSFMGVLGLRIDKGHNKAELAYWIGKPYWGKGYMTEAVKRIIRFGFENVNLNRIYAAAMTKNPASYKVMEKTGMKYEGTLKEHYLKWGQYEDIVYYGILKSEYENM